jgi:hypothetical protein
MRNGIVGITYSAPLRMSLRREILQFAIVTPVRNLPL